MESIASFLKQTRLLEELSLAVIERYIVPLGTIRSYEKDRYLFLSGQRVEEIHIVISGKVNSLYYYADGSYALSAVDLPLRVLALDLIATKTRIAPYCAVAAEASTVFSFPVDVVLQPGVLPETERQTVLRQLLIMLSHLHMQKEKHLMILSRNGLRDRILIYLSLQAQWKKTDSFTIPFSREELAAYLCVNRSCLSHELSVMKKEGLIDFSKNRFTLLQYDGETIPEEHHIL